MARSKKGSLPALGLVLWMLSIPSSFFAGLVTGLVAPLAAIAAMVAGVRLFTGKVPFLARAEENDEDSGGQLTIRLVPVVEAGPLFAEQKEQLRGEFSAMRAEIQAVMEEAKAGAQTAPAEGGPG
jgi:hypothetical protein